MCDIGLSNTMGSVGRLLAPAEPKTEASEECPEAVNEGEGEQTPTAPRRLARETKGRPPDRYKSQETFVCTGSQIENQTPPV